MSNTLKYTLAFGILAIALLFSSNSGDSSLIASLSKLVSGSLSGINHQINGGGSF
jgi:hypothetical protein